jgi:hypothetical protein
VNLIARLSLVLIGLIFSINTHAAIVTYNFGGVLTSASDPSSLLGEDRRAQVGDSFHAIYTIDTDAIAYGASYAPSFTSAIVNFAFYVNNVSLVDSSYRNQSFRLISGSINGKPADWVEMSTVGGIDNYNNSYSLNSHGEFIESGLVLTDLAGSALDSYFGMPFGSVPTIFDLDSFTSKTIRIVGESSVDSSAANYQLRGDITSFSNEGFSPVPIPSAVWLFGSALLGLGAMKRKRN